MHTAPSPLPVDPPRVRRAYRRLTAAIVLQAVRDAASPYADLSGPARWWLESEGLALCLLLGLDLAPIRAWLEGGCPPLSIAPEEE